MYLMMSESKQAAKGVCKLIHVYVHAHMITITFLSSRENMLECVIILLWKIPQLCHLSLLPASGSQRHCYFFRAEAKRDRQSLSENGVGWVLSNIKFYLISQSSTPLRVPFIYLGAQIFHLYLFQFRLLLREKEPLPPPP
jgi:hypothetical protein